jgi:hypothetical protein
MRTIKRYDVDFDKLFADDISLYYDIATKYLNLGTEDFTTAFETCKEAWVLADRWANIAANAGKMATMEGTSKTDLKDYCHRKYRQMQYIHEHCRMMYRIGENEIKQQRYSGQI